MKLFNILSLCSLLLSFSCKENNKEQKEPLIQSHVEIQGHRGDRGNFPENSIPAFVSAVKKGVDVIELDVVISKDNKVVVSHEPFMHSLYVLTPQGDSIPENTQETYNLYEMTYDSIKMYDAGSKGNRLFPQQLKQKTYKPLLSEVIDTLKQYVKDHGLDPVHYNIELKSSPSKYGIYQPNPQDFVALVMEEITRNGIENKMYLQSFDVNILNEIHSKFPEVRTSYLVSSPGIRENLSLLEYPSDIYSPHHSLVRDSAFVDSIKKLNMQLIPWTVNESAEMSRLIELKVDGIITDYPEKLTKLNY